MENYNHLGPLIVKSWEEKAEKKLGGESREHMEKDLSGL